MMSTGCTCDTCTNSAGVPSAVGVPKNIGYASCATTGRGQMPGISSISVSLWIDALLFGMRRFLNTTERMMTFQYGLANKISLRCGWRSRKNFGAGVSTGGIANLAFSAQWTSDLRGYVIAG